MADIGVQESTREKVQTDDTTNTTAFKMCSYPSSLANNTAHSNYLVFHIADAMTDGNLKGQTLQTKRRNFLKNPAGMKTLGMIQMYMPALLENYEHKYADNENTPMDALIGGAFEEYNRSGDIMQAGVTGLKRGANTLIQDKTKKNVELKQQLGVIQGQRQTLLYGGTQLRTQNFMFTLRARNLTELKQIGEIIHMFRKFSSGTMTNDIVNVSGEEQYGSVKMPPVWFVEERTKGTLRSRHIDKFMMGPATVTSVKVNKTPDQLYQSISGTAGDPVSVELEVTLKEMVPCYSDFWDSLRSITNGGGLAGQVSVATTSIGGYVKQKYNEYFGD